MAHILIVEDDERLRGFIRDALAAGGHEVVEAAVPAEGLRQFELSPAHILVTSVVSSERGGFDTILDLKRQYLGVAIIAIADRTADVADALGAKVILEKPLLQHDLLVAVERCLALGSRNLIRVKRPEGD